MRSIFTTALIRPLKKFIAALKKFIAFPHPALKSNVKSHLWDLAAGLDFLGAPPRAGSGCLIPMTA